MTATIFVTTVTASMVAAVVGASAPNVRLSNGVEMPLVSVGTWLYNDTAAAQTVLDGLSVGFTHIDTAFDYGNQKGVGKVLSQWYQTSGKKREDVFVTTKVPGCGIQGLGRDDCYNNTMQLINEDIEQMSAAGSPLKYLDLLLIHFPPCVVAENDPTQGPQASACFAKKTGCSDPRNCAAVRDQWRAVEDAYSNKLVRAVGVSNYCSACFACLGETSVRPMVNQVQLHIGMGPDPQGFLSFAKKEGFVMQAWSPLGNGGHGNPEILSGNLTMGIAKAHGKSTAQVALKWLVSRGTAVATKSSSLEHLKEDIDLFDWELSADEMKALDSANFAMQDTPSFLCDDKPLAAGLDLLTIV